MLDDVPPPAKRMKLQAAKKVYPLVKKENQISTTHVQSNQKQDVRKRKVPAQRRSGPNLLDLNSHVLLEVFEYLNLEDLCILAETNFHLQQLARQSFRIRANNRIDFNLNRHLDCAILKRLLNTFGDLITSITISSSR